MKRVKSHNREIPVPEFFFNRVPSWGHAASVKRGSGTDFAQFLGTTFC